MSDRLSPRALGRATLARQMLLERANVAPVAAVERLAGMQAQVPKPPYIGLWSRIDGFSRDLLTRAVLKRDIVRATLMRGTLHLVSKKDYFSFRPALQPVLTRIVRSVIKDRASEEILAEGRAFFAEKPRTFDELRKHLAQRYPSGDHRAMAYFVRMHLPLIQLPSDDDQWAYPASADFALADEWLKKTVPATAKTDAIALRYFAAFGPATIADFQTWSGFAAAREIVEPLRTKLRTYRDSKNRELFDFPDAPRPDEETPAPVRFLPEYDNILLAHADRTRIIVDEYRPRVATANLRILATFLVDGMVAGTWETKRKKAAATMHITPFAKVTKAGRNELAEEGERLLRFIEDDASSFAVEIAK